MARVGLTSGGRGPVPCVVAWSVGTLVLLWAPDPAGWPCVVSGFTDLLVGGSGAVGGPVNTPSLLLGVAAVSFCVGARDGAAGELLGAVDGILVTTADVVGDGFISSGDGGTVVVVVVAVVAVVAVVVVVVVVVFVFSTGLSPPCVNAALGLSEFIVSTVVFEPVAVGTSSESDRGSSSSAQSASAERIVSWPRAGSRWLRVRASEQRERGRRSGRPGCGSGGRVMTRGSRVALQRPLLATAAAELD